MARIIELNAVVEESLKAKSTNPQSGKALSAPETHASVDQLKTTGLTPETQESKDISEKLNEEITELRRLADDQANALEEWQNAYSRLEKELEDQRSRIKHFEENKSLPDPNRTSQKSEVSSQNSASSIRLAVQPEMTSGSLRPSSPVTDSATSKRKTVGESVKVFLKILSKM
jgi:septal ring factor EnvC (AmiA/AmiB activator)